jgi:hypothetical protein
MGDPTQMQEDQELEAITAFDDPTDDDDDDAVDYPDPEDLELDPPPDGEGDDVAAHESDAGAAT